MSSRLVHICKSVKSSKHFSKKAHKHFSFKKTCKTIEKLRTAWPIRFLRRRLKKLSKKKPLMSERRKKNKILLQSYTPCLDSQSVKKPVFNTTKMLTAVGLKNNNISFRINC